jgi:hypothetical protein
MIPLYILEGPRKGDIIIMDLFWFVEISLFEKSVLNLNVMVHESWKATTLEAQQKSVNLLTEVVL